MNIRRIIREELEGVLDSSDEDWEWTKDTDVYVPIKHFRDLEKGKEYYMDYRVGYDNEKLKVPMVYEGGRSTSVYFQGEDRPYTFFIQENGILGMIRKGEIYIKEVM